MSNLKHNSPVRKSAGAKTKTNAQIAEPSATVEQLSRESVDDFNLTGDPPAAGATRTAEATSGTPPGASTDAEAGTGEHDAFGNGPGRVATMTPKPQLRVITGTSPARGSLTLRIRGLRQREDHSHFIDAASPAEALSHALDRDVSAIEEPLLIWANPKIMVSLDIDRSSGAAPVNGDDIAKYFPESLPRPFAAWATHDGGLRPIFVAADGLSAVEAAAVWYLAAPLGPLLGWRVEVKTDGRHPAGERDGTRCGPVLRFPPSATVTIPGARDRAVASPEEIQAWLDEHHLTYGRHGAQVCPSCGGAPANCNPCVVINESGLGCYRCQKRFSWDILVGRIVETDRPSLYDAAKALVHFPHQELVMAEMRPMMPRELLQPAWKVLLNVANRDYMQTLSADELDAFKDRIDRAASDRVDVVRSTSGDWLDRPTLKKRKLSADRTLKLLPWARSPIMVDAAANSGPLKGFTTITPVDVGAVIGPFVEPPAGAIFSRAERSPRDLPPVDLGSEPPAASAVARAWVEIDIKLPKIDRAYVETMLVVQMVAQRGIGTPPIVVVTGPTGAAKTAVQHLVASMVGTRAGSFELGESKATLRALGTLLNERYHVTYVDEVGRIYDLYKKLEPILRANSTITYERKYENEAIASMKAPIALLGSTLPASIVRSPEIARRCVGVRLHGAKKNWKLENGVDLAAARTINGLREHLDVITAAVWWDVHQLGPNGDWRQLCLSYGAVPLESLDLLDADAGGRDKVVRQLYEAYRSAKEEDLSKGIRWAGWLIANPKTKGAGELLEELVDFEDRARQEADVADLERLNMESVLGFARPALVLKIQRRSNWLVKFVETGVAKGRGTPRKSLPPPVDPPEQPAGDREQGTL